MLLRVKIVFTLLFCFSISNSQTLNYYFGNLHSHSGYSDGSKDSASTGVSKPAGGYAFAKLSQHFDFLGISEHNHYSNNNNPGMVRTSYGLGLSEAAAANTGSFLCLYGMEYGVISNGGHVVIYGFNQLIGWETTGAPVSPNYDIYNGKLKYDSLWRLVKNNPNAFATLAHPNYTDYNSLASASVNPMWDSAIVGVPFRSGLALNATTNYTDYPTNDFFNYYRILLNRGYHLGAGYDHDNHYLNFGRGNAGRLVVMTPTLTQTNLFAAMKAMHFYGSDDWNCKLDFKIGTNMMGDTICGNGYPVINVVHNDEDGEMADSIKIWSGIAGSWQDPTVVAMVKQSNTLLYNDNTVTLGKQHYFFVEVVQNDGDRIISSPIWYRAMSQIGVKENSNVLSFIMFPNPVSSKLNISLGTCDNYSVEIIDVAGKKIFEKNYNEPDITISTASFEKGFYLISMRARGFSKTQSLIVGE